MYLQDVLHIPDFGFINTPDLVDFAEGSAECEPPEHGGVLRLARDSLVVYLETLM